MYEFSGMLVYVLIYEQDSVQFCGSVDQAQTVKTRRLILDFQWPICWQKKSKPTRVYPLCFT